MPTIPPRLHPYYHRLRSKTFYRRYPDHRLSTTFTLDLPFPSLPFLPTNPAVHYVAPLVKIAAFTPCTCMNQHCSSRRGYCWECKPGINHLTVTRLHPLDDHMATTLAGLQDQI